MGVQSKVGRLQPELSELSMWGFYIQHNLIFSKKHFLLPVVVLSVTLVCPIFVELTWNCSLDLTVERKLSVIH